MFIAHHLITIHNVFQHRLDACSPPAPGLGVPGAEAPGVPGVPGRPAGSSGQLMDVVAWLKRLGNDNFTQHVALKKQQLTDHLRTDKGV